MLSYNSVLKGQTYKLLSWNILNANENKGIKQERNPPKTMVKSIYAKNYYKCWKCETKHRFILGLLCMKQDSEETISSDIYPKDRLLLMAWSFWLTYKFQTVK